MVADVLELADNVVSEISHRPRGEWGYARYDRRTMLTQQFLDHLKDISVTPLAAPASLDLDGFAASANPHVRPHAEEGVAANLLGRFLAPAIQRPLVSIVAIKAGDPFEVAKPEKGVTIRVRCAWENTTQGQPKKPIAELV